MIRLDLKSKSFGTQQILGAFELSVQGGERVAILGPSGVGKSTLLRIIAGLDRAFVGSLSVTDGIAMVFQEPTLLPWRSVTENLSLTTGASSEAIADALDAVGLSGQTEKYPGHLSLGQQRRVALARALTAKPSLLLLDEPFASLDEALAVDMRGLVNRLLNDREMAVVLVTHAADDAEAIGAIPMRLAGSPATLQAD